MNVALRIPEDLADRLGDEGDVSRRALEAFAVEEHRAGGLALHELRQLLGFGTRAELDGFLKARGINGGATIAESKRNRQTVDRLGTPVARIRTFRTGKTLGGLDPAALIREGRR